MTEQIAKIGTGFITADIPTEAQIGDRYTITLDVLVSQIAAELIDITPMGSPPNTAHALGYKTYTLQPVTAATVRQPTHA